MAGGSYKRAVILTALAALQTGRNELPEKFLTLHNINLRAASTIRNRL
jgi:hypothetical protein